MEPMLDKTQVAELLGVSPRTVERWVSERVIPFTRVGRLVRFRESRLEEWLAESERVPLN